MKREEFAAGSEELAGLPRRTSQRVATEFAAGCHGIRSGLPRNSQRVATERRVRAKIIEAAARMLSIRPPRRQLSP